MSRARRVACAAGLILLSVVGCEGSGCFLAQCPCKWFACASQDAGDRIVAGSIDSVAQSTQSALSELGLFASLTRTGEEVRIASGKEGSRFTFVLTRVEGKEGESTRVRIEWDKEAKNKDAQVVQLLATLTVSQAGPATSAQK